MPAPNAPTQATLRAMWAVRDIILGLSPAIVPKTTLASNVAAGATSFTIVPVNNASGASRIPAGGQISFGDNLGEEEALPVDTVDPVSGLVKLDVNGLGYPGLQYGHSAGAAIYSNLQVATPHDIAGMLTRGDPFLFVTCKRHRTPSPQTNLKVFEQLRMHVQYHRQLSRPNDVSIDINRWAGRAEVAMHQDLDAVRDAILHNIRASSPSLGGPAFLKLGTISRDDTWIDSFWDKPKVDADTWQYVGALDFDATTTGRFIGK